MSSKVIGQNVYVFCVCMYVCLFLCLLGWAQPLLGFLGPLLERKVLTQLKLNFNIAYYRWSIDANIHAFTRPPAWVPCFYFYSLGRRNPFILKTLFLLNYDLEKNGPDGAVVRASPSYAVVRRQ